VVVEHGVDVLEGVLHIVVFEMEYPSRTKSEVDEDEVLDVVLEAVEVELEDVCF
jgi:hypothetical protein